MLMGPLAQVGLALATSIGAWINLGLVGWFGIRAGHIPDRAGCGNRRSSGAAGLVLAVVLWLCGRAGHAVVSGLAWPWRHWRP